MKAFAVLVLWFGLAFPAWPADMIDELFFFGDSLTDTGNLAFARPELVPTPPFEPGRFCNGLIWPEYLASLILGDITNGLPYYYGYRSAEGNNYAVGGASTADNPAQPDAIDLPEQVEAVIEEHGGVLNPNAVYALYIGSFDQINYLNEVNPADIKIGQVLFRSWQSGQNIYAAIRTLHAAGARRFLVLNSFDFSLVPLVTSRNLQPYAFVLTIISNEFLRVALTRFELELSGDLYRLDLFTLSRLAHLDSLLLGGLLFGLHDFTNPCLLTIDGELVPDPDCSGSTYIDPVHPTTLVHLLVATEAANVLARPPLYSVPEP